MALTSFKARLLTATIFAAIGAAATAEDIGKPTNFDIPAGDLGAALRQLAQQSDNEIMFSADMTRGKKVRAITGSYQPSEALDLLLRGSGLTYKISGNTFTVVAPQKDAAAAPARSMQTAAAQATEGAAVRSEPAANAFSVEEVVVTAQKTSEKLQDVPVPVAVINADRLAENNQVKLKDYFQSVPGFVVSPTSVAGNQQMLIIRGVSSGSFGNPTVSTIIDEVPYGAFTRELAPDVDPSDLARVEVLRGPQGTLYGASSMGGLIKYVTIDPSTDGYSGRLQADVNDVHNGAEVGYALRGAVNVPVSSVFAVRASAYTRRDAGYIDNPVRGYRGLNEGRNSGGRVSALWNLSEDLSLKVSAAYQKATGDGNNDVIVTPGLGDLQQNYLPGTGIYSQEIQAYSAVLSGTFGGADLTSVSGYNTYNFSNSNDYSAAFAATAQRLFPGISGAKLTTDGRTGKFSQELRAFIPLTDNLDWLIGGFYTHEDIPFLQQVFAVNPAATTGAAVGTIQTLDIPIRHTEYAAFTDLTVHFTERFEVQIGGRQSHLKENFEAVTQGGALFPTPVIVPAITSKADVFTFLVTPKFTISPDIMVYARAASGYRPGRSNSFNADPLVPRASTPDKTRNYEIGSKGQLLDGILTFDVSLYHIDFKNIQINLINPRNNASYFTNGSAAKSEGVEVSLDARPWDGLTASAWVTYNKAVLTEAFPVGSTAFGPVGARLPYSARFSSNLSVTQDFPITDALTGYAGFTLSRIGERFGPFAANATAARAVYPAYTEVDLRAGMRFDAWLANVYVNNIGDKRGVVGGGPGIIPPNAYLYVQPRTIGLSVTRTF